MLTFGISGQAGVGKDTTADYLAERLGFVKIPFADEVKRVAMRLWGFSEETLWGPSPLRNVPDKRYTRDRHPRHDWDDCGAGWACSRCGLLGDESADQPECFVYLTPRFACQEIGERGRVCYINTWVDIALRNARKVLEEGKEYSRMHGPCDGAPKAPSPPYSGVVISDCRYSNEFDRIHEEGGKLIRLKRASAGLKGSAGQHSSETEQISIPDSKFDLVLGNNGTIEELYRQLDEFVASVR